MVIVYYEASARLCALCIIQNDVYVHGEKDGGYGANVSVLFSDAVIIMLCCKMKRG
jgi:hypothetical protein